MIGSNGYTIQQVVDSNKIVIGLPQTKSTLTNTNLKTSDRKQELDIGELFSILELVMILFEGNNIYDL
ncbi:MAG: hypothetical protein MJZ37_06385 [Bacilli bacterium]|nr:hypothetical protein [Bacilli bacterium]